LWGNESFPTMQTFPTMPITNVRLSTQCTVYKRVCACPSPTNQTPQRIFTADSLKDAYLRKDVPFEGLDNE